MEAAMQGHVLPTDNKPDEEESFGCDVKDEGEEGAAEGKG